MGAVIHHISLIAVRIFLIAIAGGAIALLSPSLARADSHDMGWSWTAGQPTVLSSQPISDITVAGLCPWSYQTRDIVGVIGSRQVCVTPSDSVHFGTYYSGGSYVPVIGFGYDTKMYPMTGTSCGAYDGCIYSPAADMLITKQHLINGLVRSLVIYKNVTDRLTKVVSELTPTLEYSFDSANPDYIFQSASGYAWPVGGVAVSDNGEWVAVEFRQRGIGLLNTKTLEMKRVSTLSFTYGLGFNPTPQLSVTDDGRYIAVMGIYAGLTLFEVTSSCGDIATDDNLSGVTPQPADKRCKGAPIDSGAFIYRLEHALHPRFNEKGAELRFYALSYVGEQKEVILRASGFDSPRLDYLALGDSFSSGEGETDDTYYVEGTNDQTERCHVSTRSYPFLLAQELGVDMTYMRSVACSGAKMGDLHGDIRNYWGQGERLRNNGDESNGILKTVAQTSAGELFIPGRIHQTSFVSRYQPKVITVGIGGNDAGMMAKLQACIGPNTCTWASTSEGREKTALEIQSLFNGLASTYTAIHDASPQSKIYVIGYPKIIDSSGQCDLLHSLLIDNTEKEFMDQAIIYLNAVIAAAAEKAGVKYLDIQDSLADQVLCGQGSPQAMNGIRLGDDSGLSADYGWFKIIGQESFHPRPLAQQMMVDSLRQSVLDITQYNYCDDLLQSLDRICPVFNVEPPKPSAYWLPDGTTHNYARQQIGEFVTDADAPRQKNIQMPQRSFAAGSEVTIELHSTPVLLGSADADQYGALSFAATLPDDITEGYHTVHLYGTSYSGELIDVYQVIAYDVPDISPAPDGDDTGNNEPEPITDNTSTPPKEAVTKIEDSEAVVGTASPIIARPATIPAPLEVNPTQQPSADGSAVASVLGDATRARQQGFIPASQPVISKNTNSYVLAALVVVLIGGVGYAVYAIKRR